MKPLTTSFLLGLALLPWTFSQVAIEINPAQPQPPPKQPYRGKEIHASGKKFYALKPTNVSCPPADSFACPECIRTIFSVPHGGAPQNLTLFSYEGANQGPQQVYVAHDNTLSFTAPDEAVPATALTYGFSTGPLNELFANGLNPYICHNKKTGDYQAYFGLPSKSPKSCDANFFLPVSAFGAFEYV